jgi:hypothetical protein
MPRHGRGEFSQGPLPAHRRRAVPTRQYQCGGQPIHTVPARRPIPQAARPPPPQHAPTVTHQADHALQRDLPAARKPCHPPGKTVALTIRSISEDSVRSARGLVLGGVAGGARNACRGGGRRPNSPAGPAAGRAAATRSGRHHWFWVAQPLQGEEAVRDGDQGHVVMDRRRIHSHTTRQAQTRQSPTGAWGQDHAGEVPAW